MADSENLGAVVPWQIRDIPAGIRDAVVEQARVEGVKVPDLVTRLVLDARAAGWTMRASTMFANSSNGQSQEFTALLDAACRLIGTPIAKGNGRLAAQARATLGAQLARITPQGAQPVDLQVGKPVNQIEGPD